MKVCMLTTGFPRFQGDFCGNFVLDLARALVRAGAQVRAVCPHQAGLPTADEFDGVQVRRFRYALPASLQKLAYGGGIPANIGKSWLARLEVPGFLAAMAAGAVRWGRGADVIHAHWAVSGLVGAAARAVVRRPVVVTVRGSDLKREQGPVSGWAVSRALRSAARVLAVSEDLRSEVLGRGVPARRVLVLPNGVDLELFSGRDRAPARERLGLDPGARVALFVGQLAPVKNPGMLAEAAGRLGDMRPRAEFHIVGDGPEAGAVRARAGELGAADRVLFHGAKPHDEIPAWLAAADVLVLPSLSEGRPNVVLEAMSAARAVVATRVGGTPELVAEGESGLLVAPGDAGAFAAAVRGLLADPSRAEAMGAAGRARIEKLGLSSRAVAAGHLRVYEEVLAGG